jgi:AcrR family transcriptional regulator
MTAFRANGFDATTVEEIARRARVAKGTMFNFFPTKGAILLMHYEALDAEFGRALALLTPEDPKAALVRFYAEAEAILRTEGPLAAEMFRQIALDADLRNIDTDSGDKDRETLVAFFRECRARGTLSPQVEPTVAAHLVADLWSATVQDWLRTGQRYSLKLRLATKLDALFKGLAP